MIHVPPSGIWGYGGHGVYTAAPGRSRRRRPSPTEAFDELVRTYLAAYGPATKQDVGQWAGVPRLKPIAESLERLTLRTFRDEDGKVLYDLPRARRCPIRRRRRRRGSCRASTTSSSRTPTARGSSATSPRRGS